MPEIRAAGMPGRAPPAHFPCFLGRYVPYNCHRPSRKSLWITVCPEPLARFVQRVRELLVDDDQDCIWLRVDVEGGASCHVGYRSCFYRRVPTGEEFGKTEVDGRVELVWTDSEKVFDPEDVYGDAPNPTIL